MADIPSLPAPGAPFVDSGGRITTEWYLLLKGLYPLLRLAQSAVQEIPVDETVLHNDVSDTLAVGFLSPAHDNGTVGSGTFTLDAAAGAIQKLTNTGAHAWAVPADGTSVLVRVVNGTGAGPIDISAFAGHAGDDFDAVAGNKFWASVSAAESEGVISIVADEANT